MAGYVTQQGAFAQAGGVLHRLPATPQTVGAWMAGVIAAIDAGEITPCRHCGLFECDCEDWLEWMAMVDANADPHGELDHSMQIPY